MTILYSTCGEWYKGQRSHTCEMKNFCPLFTDEHLDISTTQGQIGTTLIKDERLHLKRKGAENRFLEAKHDLFIWSRILGHLWGYLFWLNLSSQFKQVKRTCHKSPLKGERDLWNNLLLYDSYILNKFAFPMSGMVRLPYSGNTALLQASWNVSLCQTESSQWFYGNYWLFVMVWTVFVLCYNVSHLYCEGAHISKETNLSYSIETTGFVPFQGRDSKALKAARWNLSEEISVAILKQRRIKNTELTNRIQLGKPQSYYPAAASWNFSACGDPRVWLRSHQQQWPSSSHSRRRQC